MLDWQTLVRLPEAELARLDIAFVNLCCATGLPGADQYDVEFCINTLNDWAIRCARFTERVLPYYRIGQCDYADSEPRFRIQAMITHLQRDIGVRYHPERIAEDAIFQPEDSFVSGVIQCGGGTCGSLPVIYAAVGRRLGYPIKLSTTRTHLFCRWDARPCGECFNVEASGQGISFHEDEYFRTGRFEMDEEMIQKCGFLESLSPREELAMFMEQRGECWLEDENYLEAATSFAWANELDPRRQQHKFETFQALQKWEETLHVRIPQLFPKLELDLPAWQLMALPRELERKRMALEVA